MTAKTEPVAIIENGIVVNGELLKRYWLEENERRYRIRRGMFIDRESLEPSPLSLQRKGEPEPAWAQRQWQSVQQQRAMINYLQNKLVKHLTSPKKKQGIKMD